MERRESTGKSSILNFNDTCKVLRKCRQFLSNGFRYNMTVPDLVFRYPHRFLRNAVFRNGCTVQPLQFSAVFHQVIDRYFVEMLPGHFFVVELLHKEQGPVYLESDTCLFLCFPNDRLIRCFVKVNPTADEVEIRCLRIPDQKKSAGMADDSSDRKSVV